MHNRLNMAYYDDIASGYNELHKEEQLKKLKLIEANIAIKKSDCLLDVGCGTGISTTYWGCNAVGIDPSEGLLRQAKPAKNARFIKASSESIPFKDNEFDWVTAITSIHNFENIEKGLQEIKRVGKKQFVLTVLKKSPKRRHIIDSIKRLFTVKKELEEEKDVILICEK
jgi:demethylmenaquinone methyltransferase/2-methoxy-6-polyprenyl-1,4-benzoquinol methylase